MAMRKKNPIEVPYNNGVIVCEVDIHGGFGDNWNEPYEPPGVELLSAKIHGIEIVYLLSDDSLRWIEKEIEEICSDKADAAAEMYAELKKEDEKHRI